MRRVRILISLCVCFIAAACPGAATVLTLPSLSPGSQFRILFVTSVTGLGADTDINNYNALVNSVANAGGSELQPLGATWSIVGSTQTVSALTNIGGPSAVPIYLLDGTLVANDTAELFSGTLLAGIDFNELGASVPVSTQVWTGTSTDGSSDLFGHYLGNAFNDVEFGVTGTSNGAWVHFNDGNAGLFSDPYYGISSVLTIPAAATPEPTTTVSLLTGALLIGIMEAKRRSYRARQ